MQWLAVRSLLASTPRTAGRLAPCEEVGRTESSLSDKLRLADLMTERFAGKRKSRLIWTRKR
eukprot:4943967-Pleurochrysis_carterae.AAC.1